MGNLTRSSLRDQAARAIRTGIITGEIAPGELYSVPTLASRLGVSATPVREAMLDLVGEGLVVSVRNRGYRVVSLSPHDLDAILEIRLMLEVPSTRAVAVSRRDEDVPGLRALAEQLPKLAKAGDFQTYLDVDQEFHLGVVGLLDNPRLVDIVGMLRNQTRLFDVSKLVSIGGLNESAAEHVAIAAAIERGDGPGAEELAKQHLLRSRKAWSDDADGAPAGRLSSSG